MFMFLDSVLFSRVLLFCICSERFCFRPCPYPKHYGSVLGLVALSVCVLVFSVVSLSMIRPSLFLVSCFLFSSLLFSFLLLSFPALLRVLFCLPLFSCLILFCVLSSPSLFSSLFLDISSSCLFIRPLQAAGAGELQKKRRRRRPLVLTATPGIEVAKVMGITDLALEELTKYKVYHQGY